MLCRNCAREIPDNSVFCNWCGERQIPERTKKDEIRVPTPRKFPSDNWRIVLRADENNKYVQKAANKNDASQRTYRY